MLLCLSIGAIDLIEHAAIVEMDLLDLLPAANDLSDREQADTGKLRRILGSHRGEARTIIVFGRDLLPSLFIQNFRFGQRQGDDARIYAIDHRPGLLDRALMLLMHRDALV